MKIPERWKRPFRIALIIMALVILTIANKYYVQFSMKFSFGSQPVTTEPPAEKALRTGATWTIHEYSLLVTPIAHSTTSTH